LRGEGQRKGRWKKLVRAEKNVADMKKESHRLNHRSGRDRVRRGEKGEKRSDGIECWVFAGRWTDNRRSILEAHTSVKKMSQPRSTGGDDGRPHLHEKNKQAPSSGRQGKMKKPIRPQNQPP